MQKRHGLPAAFAFVVLAAACDGGGTSVPTPAQITAASPATQQATPGSAVATPPSVRVLDGQGQPLAGVGVTFAVTAGGGTLGTPLATTDATGTATAGSWTLGPNLGTHTVTATVSGLAPVTFTATAVDPCETAVAYTLLSTIQASLTAQDCTFQGGYFTDLYSVGVAQARGVTIRMSSDAVDAYLELYDGQGNVVAVDDDDISGDGPNSALRVFMPAGNYFLAASSFDPGEVGAYTLSSQDLPGNVNCQLPWVVPNLAIDGQISATDCADGGYYSDIYAVVLQAGQRLNLSMTSTVLDPYLIVFDASGNVMAQDDDSGTGLDAQLSYVAPATGVYLIDAGTSSTGETGAYTLTVQRVTAQVGPAASVSPRAGDLLGARSKARLAPPRGSRAPAMR